MHTAGWDIEYYGSQSRAVQTCFVVGHIQKEIAEADDQNKHSGALFSLMNDVFFFQCNLLLSLRCI